MRNNLLARSPTVERTFWNSGLPGDFPERVARLFDARPERIWRSYFDVYKYA